jgi:hypothetical protein
VISAADTCAVPHAACILSTDLVLLIQRYPGYVSPLPSSLFYTWFNLHVPVLISGIWATSFLTTTSFSARGTCLDTGQTGSGTRLKRRGMTGGTIVSKHEGLAFTIQ